MKSVTVRRELTDTEHKLVDESNYITAKLVEINDYINNNPEYKTLDRDDQCLILEQRAAMTEYSFAVFTRLSKCMPEISAQLQLEEIVTG